jgi:hypothetical protein
MIHFDERGDALRSPEPEYRRVRFRRHRIAVERDDPKEMPR